MHRACNKRICGCLGTGKAILHNFKSKYILLIEGKERLSSRR